MGPRVDRWDPSFQGGAHTLQNDSIPAEGEGIRSLHTAATVAWEPISGYPPPPHVTIARRRWPSRCIVVCGWGWGWVGSVPIAIACPLPPLPS